MSTSPDSSKPAASTTMPVSRDLVLGSYQVLQTANGRTTFFAGPFQAAINEGDSPLARFLPSATYSVRDEKNKKPASVAYKITPAEVASARPLRFRNSKFSDAQNLTKAEIDAFKQAVADFKTGATTNPQYQQYRQEFRLPDPKLEPNAYWVVGQGANRRLLILWGCERFARTSVTPEHVADYLEKNCDVDVVKKSPLPKVLAVVAVLAVAAGAGAYVLLSTDSTPPVVKDVASAGGNTIEVTFNEALDPGVPAKAVAFADDKLRVSALALSPSDPSVLVVTTESPVIDGEKYVLILTEAIKDKAGNALQRIDATLDFNDAIPPKLVPEIGVSAGSGSVRELLLTFDKIINEASLNPKNLTIRPVVDGEPGKAMRIDDIAYDPATPGGRRLLVTTEEDFQGRRQYALAIRGLTDTAVRPNRVDIEEHRFEYLDVLPPSIRAVTATGAIHTVEIEFSKPLDPAAALNPDNYAITPPGDGAQPLAILQGGITADDRGRIITVRLEPATLPPGNLRLVINNLADRDGNKLREPLERVFSFTDAATRAAPQIASVEVAANSNRLTLTFDRGVAPSSVAASNFHILDSNRAPSTITVTAATIAADDTRRVALTLSTAPAGGIAYHVVSNNLTDTFGTRQVDASRKDFRAPGIAVAMINIPFASPPELVDGNQLRLRFNVELTNESATEARNYNIQPDAPAPLRVEHQVKKSQDGTAASEVLLVFSSVLKGDITVGAQNLAVQGQPPSQRFRVRNTAAK